VRGDRATGRRLAIVAACVVSLLGACVLAWWQWNRFESASGTWQNLGYVLQWPLFGLFPAFMFWRVKRLKEREAQVRAEPVAVKPVAARPQPPPAVHEDDDELTAYNRYLAELNAKDPS
jgi:DNA-binding transcriptional regulator of glucitol operon